LDDEPVQPQFDFSSFDDSFFDRVLGDEPEHSHLLFLTDSVGSVLEEKYSQISKSEAKRMN
jgi:hypothetical protein